MPTNFDPVRVGTNVAAARKRASMTQDAMARALSISRPTYIAIESGQRAPSALELATIASQLSVSVRELANLESVDTFSALRFRGLRGLDEAQPAVDELEAFGRRYATLERLAGVRVTRREPPVFPIEGVANVERAAEELAATERLRLGLGDGPLPDLRGLLRGRRGPADFRTYESGSDTHRWVFAYSSDFGPLVGFNSAHDPRRVRWTLCHEHAHFLSDRYEAEVTIDDGARRNRPEQFADAFASRFLMPSSGISRRFSELLNDASGRMSVAHLVMLAQFFDVSFEAVTRRLEDIGRVGVGTFEMLRKRGFKAPKAEHAMGFENRKHALAAQYATEMDDGEAQTLAIAIERGIAVLWMTTPSRAAPRDGVPLISSFDLLRRWSTDASTQTAEVVAAAISMRLRANYAPRVATHCGCGTSA